MEVYPKKEVYPNSVRSSSRVDDAVLIQGLVFTLMDTIDYEEKDIATAFRSPTTSPGENVVLDATWTSILPPPMRWAMTSGGAST